MRSARASAGHAGITTVPSSGRPRSRAPAVGSALAAAVLLGLPAPAPAAGDSYEVRDLVSDGGVPAERKDKNLVNGWGVAFGPGPVWIADNGTGKSTVYNGNGKKLPLVVTIPQGAPTGIVFNDTSGFVVRSGTKKGASLLL